MLVLFVVLCYISEAIDVFNGTDLVLPFVPVVMGRHDMIEYWKNNESIVGNERFAFNLSSKDEHGIYRVFQFWFKNENNLNTFASNPWLYSPIYGGFCCWGMCCEFEPQYPWRPNNIGPPAGVTTEWNGWKVYKNMYNQSDINYNETNIYFAIWHNYTIKFLSNATNIKIANQRWLSWYGDMHSGAFNYMCLTEAADQAGQYYCYFEGQPYAPALNQSEEIHTIMSDSQVHELLQYTNIVKGV